MQNNKYRWPDFLMGIITLGYMFLMISQGYLSYSWFPSVSLLVGVLWMIYGGYMFNSAVNLAGEKDKLFPRWLLLEGFQGSLKDGTHLFYKGISGMTFMLLGIVFTLLYLREFWPGVPMSTLFILGSLLAGIVWLSTISLNALSFYMWRLLQRDASGKD